MSEQYEQSDLYRLRHTAAHVLAQAVLELCPQAKLGIGPPIADLLLRLSEYGMVYCYE